MNRVLLIDSDAVHAFKIENALRSISCRVTACVDPQKAVSFLEVELFDAVVVVPETADSAWQEFAERIRTAAMRAKEPPQVVCLLGTPYHGPDQRVYAARKGFTVVYEQ